MAHLPNGPTFDNEQLLQGIRLKLQSYHCEFVHTYEPPKIQLPLLFSIYWYHQISSNITLIDPVGNQFEVLVKKGNSRIVLSQGSERIGQYYNLFHGGWLTFIYIDERTMLMEVRDRLGEPVNYPTPAKSFLLGDMSNPINLDDANVTHPQKSILTQHEVGFHHCWVKTMSVADVTSDFLSMRGGFVQVALKHTTTHLHIADEEGKVWPCKLLWETDSASECKLTSGWLKFCKDRQLKVHGEIEPTFNEEFFDELPETWALIDENGNIHEVDYNRSLKYPLITNGWEELRTFYGMTRDHMVYLGYMGQQDLFKLRVVSTPCQPASFPKFHSCSPRSPRPSFTHTLSKFNTTASYLDLPQEFGTHVRNTEYEILSLFGPTGAKIDCKVLIRDGNKQSTKIGKGWMTFYKEHKLKTGDMLRFVFVKPGINNAVKVEKVTP